MSRCSTVSTGSSGLIATFLLRFQVRLNNLTKRGVAARAPRWACGPRVSQHPRRCTQPRRGRVSAGQTRGDSPATLRLVTAQARLAPCPAPLSTLPDYVLYHFESLNFPAYLLDEIEIVFDSFQHPESRQRSPP